MKLKYYLRGMGIGIILTAIVMGFALGGRKATLSDAEIIQRAKALGMVDGDSGVLSDTQGVETEEKADDKTSTDTSLFEEGTTLPEKEQQEVADTDPSVSEMAKEEEAGEASSLEASEGVSSTSESVAKEETASSAEATTARSDVTEKNEVAKTETKDNNTEKADDSASAASSESVKPQPQETTTQAASSSSKSINTVSKTITIPGGLGSDQVAQILYREGIIDNAVAFNKYLVDSKKDRIIRSGTKTIPAGTSYDQLASIITQ